MLNPTRSIKQKCDVARSFMGTSLIASPLSLFSSLLFFSYHDIRIGREKSKEKVTQGRAKMICLSTEMNFVRINKDTEIFVLHLVLYRVFIDNRNHILQEKSHFDWTHIGKNLTDCIHYPLRHQRMWIFLWLMISLIDLSRSIPKKGYLAVRDFYCHKFNASRTHLSQYLRNVKNRKNTSFDKQLIESLRDQKSIC